MIRMIAKCMLVVLLIFGLSPSGPAVGAEVKLISDIPLSDRLHELTLESPALGKDTSLQILLPSGYEESDETYPVLYLLHGCCGDYKAWTARTDVEQVTEDLPMIVVMPDAGRGASYSDWYNQGAYGPPKWEEYHLKELIPFIEHHYRAKGTRDGRAVAGLSMGGFGAMSYAARHPDLFAAAASFSGVLDTNLDPDFLEKTIFQDQEKVPPGTVWGNRETHEIIWRSHNPWDLAENLEDVDLAIHTGNGEAGGPLDEGLESPVERTCFAMSTSLHDRLDELKIPHIWDSYGPGSHTWGYWQRDLHQTLPRLMDIFNNPKPAPIPFSYKSAEDSFTIYEWQVAFQREEMAFAKLSNVSPKGFELIGSGKASITTAPWFKPGARHKVKISGAKGKKVIQAFADKNGRLHLELNFSSRKAGDQLSVRIEPKK
ncbi:alpha/beta hydrolase [Fictibacillus phosphorivorans]|uniref:alpha/beta hydrolase n=1 Tax=Fictibacillus phosphorivorans TaxID=1221500 RepID=UPI00203A86B1|nr:alpha/beta hydrolase family protein [Fictibacillus phosphorivorans]MCM3718317.1 esterase family protein [Fictibacillus phosphorivorans]MCM3775819.1 esterase family protein [Fictibacillus phosphorivorans]